MIDAITLYDKYNLNVIRKDRPLPIDLSKADWYYYRFNCGLFSLSVCDYIPLPRLELERNGPHLAFNDSMIMTEFDLNL